MINTKIVQRAKPLSNGTYPIYLRVTKDRKTKFISLKLACEKSQWNEIKSEFRKSASKYQQLNNSLHEISKRAEKIVSDALGTGDDISLGEFEELFFNFKIDKKITVNDFWDEHIEDMNKSGRTGNARFFRDSKNSFFKFLEDRVIYFKEITPALLDKYEVFLRSNGGIDSGIAVKMRAIRALYNSAIKKGYAHKEHYPFNAYKLSKLKGKGNKRAISSEDIMKIKNLDTDKHPTLLNTKNYFIFSYYTGGMNFFDMMKLTWENIVGDRIIYTRSKTKGQFTIKILEPVQEILEYYKNQERDTNYVFPIILREDSTPIQLEYRKGKSLKRFNKDLKKIADLCKIEHKITSYVARHSFATNLKQKGVSTDIISEAMGHQNLTITQAYLKELENDIIDDAFSKLL